MLTATRLREALGWHRVEEEEKSEFYLVYVYILPTRVELEPIYFCVDQDRSFIQQFGFGEWHYHPDDIEEAVETARLLVHGEQCVVEERDAAGKYLGSGLSSPGGLPDTMVKGTASLRRVFFDREPVAEAIDFSRYFQGKHGWLTHQRKAELERAYRKAGMQIPEW